MFIEIASGTLASSFVYGDPLTTIGSLAALAHGFNKNKNKNDLRKYKWSAIRGIAGVGAFALSTKLISIPVLNFLIGMIAATIVKKVVKSLRLFEYIQYLRNLRIYLPYILFFEKYLFHVYILCFHSKSVWFSYEFL